MLNQSYLHYYIQYVGKLYVLLSNGLKNSQLFEKYLLKEKLYLKLLLKRLTDDINLME